MLRRVTESLFCECVRRMLCQLLARSCIFAEDLSRRWHRRDTFRFELLFSVLKCRLVTLSSRNGSGFHNRLLCLASGAFVVVFIRSVVAAMNLSHAHRHLTAPTNWLFGCAAELSDKSRKSL